MREQFAHQHYQNFKKDLGDYHILSMLKEHKFILIKKKKTVPAVEGRKWRPQRESWLACGRGRPPGDKQRADTLSTLAAPSRKAPLRLPHSLFPSPSLPQLHVSWPRLGLAHARPRPPPRVRPSCLCDSLGAASGARCGWAAGLRPRAGAS